jgi:general stress protein 26
MSHDNKTESEKREKVRQLVNSIDFAFLVSQTGNGMLHGRPMSTAKVEENADVIYFAADRHSAKIEEIVRDPNVFLGYVNTSGSDWVSIAGTARAVDDRAKIHELYSAHWNNWFDGPDDPKLILIEVQPSVAEYWDSGSKLIAVAKFTFGAVTGKKMDIGENDKVTFGNAIRANVKREPAEASAVASKLNSPSEEL